MSLVINSNVQYNGELSALPTNNAPLPDGAAYYQDFKKGIYVGLSSNNEIVRPTNLAHVNSRANRLIAMLDGSIGWGVSSDYSYPDKTPLGIAVNTSLTQLFSFSSDLTNPVWLKESINVTQPDTQYQPFTITAAGSSVANIKQSFKAIASLAGVQIIAGADSARYLMVSCDEKHAFAVFDLKVGKVVNQSGVYNAYCVPFGKYFICSIGLNELTANSNYNIAFSIVNSADDNLATLTNVAAGLSLKVCYPLAQCNTVVPVLNPTTVSIATDGMTITAIQKIQVINQVTDFIKFKTPIYAQFSNALIVSVFRTVSEGRIRVSFNPFNTSTNPGRLVVDYVNDSDVVTNLYVSNEIIKADYIYKVALKVDGNKLSIYVNENTIIEDLVATMLSSTWTLDYISHAHSLNGYVHKLIQFNKALETNKIKHVLSHM